MAVKSGQPVQSCEKIIALNNEISHKTQLQQFAKKYQLVRRKIISNLIIENSTSSCTSIKCNKIFRNTKNKPSCCKANKFILLLIISLLHISTLQILQCTTTTTSTITPRINILNPVLDLNDTFSYLLEPKTGRIIAPSEYMDFENIYAPNEQYKRNITAQTRNYHLIKAFDFANYFQSDYWTYSNYADLLQSAGPNANETECQKQIRWLLSQLTRPGLEENVLFGKGEQHLNLMTMIDSYGKPDAATFSGHNLWIGSYHECSHVQLNVTKFELEQCLADNGAASDPTVCNSINDLSSKNDLIRGRYCLGKARDIDWPEDNYKPQITYKIGLCLPETCQTKSMIGLRTEIDKLMKVGMANVWRKRLHLVDMYCLPDEQSPLRRLSFAGYIVLSFIIGWIALILIATIVYSCYKRNEETLRSLILISEPNQADTYQDASDNFATLTMNPKLIANNSIATAAPITTTTNLLLIGQSDKLHVSSRLSISSHYWLRDSPGLIKFLKSLSLVENSREFREPPRALREPNSTKTCRINLNPLDCIKCFCCIFVIFGHIVFIHMQHMNNITHTIELSYNAAPRILIALFNFVDTFFIISGMLTSYFIFKRFNAKTFANPLIWFYISFMRLLRLSPVYILVFWFTKTLTVHITSGPLWDYATDKNSIKGLCANDYWWKSLLYLGNWNTMQPLCILPAWSIIVDSQYSLILPPIIFLVMKYRTFGYTSMLIAVIVSTMHMSWQLANQNAVKPSDMAKIRLHVYPLISRFAAEFYNTAFNRIGPVAIGILGGHALYLYDIGKIRQWPAFMRGLGFKLILIMHVFIMILPTLGKLTDDPASRDDTDLTIFILSNSSIKPIWSLVNTALILRLITDLRQHSILAQLMSHNLWHCLGKLCFISYLIHYEIILVLLKSRQEGLVDPNWSNAGREFSYAFLLSTALSYCIYLLYEAPVNNLIMCAMRVKEQMAARTQNKQVEHPNNSTNCNNVSCTENGNTMIGKFREPQAITKSMANHNSSLSNILLTKNNNQPQDDQDDNKQFLIGSDKSCGSKSNCNSSMVAKQPCHLEMQPFEKSIRG